MAQIHHSFPLFCYWIHTFKVQFAPQFYYFAPAFNIRIFTAKAVTILSVEHCTASSADTDYSGVAYSCDQALGSSTGQWRSNNDGTSAWIRVELNEEKIVTKLEIKSRCSYTIGNNVKEVDVEFDDGSTQSVIIIYYVGWMETLQSSLEIYTGRQFVRLGFRS